MITLQFATRWHICTPTIFRYLEKQFVEDFFRDGSLRVSSFADFKKHKDEQRLDLKEGESFFIHSTKEGGGQTIAAKIIHNNAYVLCGSMICSSELMTAFQRDSYIRINDSTQFGICVSRQIPNLKAGAEGPCLYQVHKVVGRDIGYVDPAKVLDPRTLKGVNVENVSKLVNEQTQHFPYFLKHRSYLAQMEYRLLWITNGEVAGSLDIKAPEAIQYCSRPDAITE